MGGVAWTEEEDNLLKRCVEKYGEGKWHRIPLLAGLNRCRKSCRLRWLNYLRPNIKRGSFSAEEVELIFKLHDRLGNRWSSIAGRLPGRTANDVKNYWNCHLSKKFGSQETENNKRQTSITGEIVEESVPLVVSSGLIGSIVENPTTTMEKDEHTPAIQNHVDPINHKKRTIFQEEEPWMGDEISALDLQYFEGARSVEDRKGSGSMWDWEDLVLDIDLWSKSL